MTQVRVKIGIWVCIAWSPDFSSMQAIFNRRRKNGERVKLLVNGEKHGKTNT